ncbi:MAG TPA: sulfite exporter TauE/SafE family protein [Thermoanaerobaculia bacterium]|nr:sulfite exporter TauE/SafE family protein [Thermoanaerobaculia bacterium]
MVDINLYVALPLVVATFSVVQSIFGVGLLLFGTPTLLLLGMPFPEAIAALLPCSLAVDLLQLRNGLPANRAYIRRLFGVTLPLVCLGLIIALTRTRPEGLALLVGAMLLVLGLLRCASGAVRRIQSRVVRYQTAYMAGMGFLHGLSNMGGGLLVVLASALTNEKEETRRIIAVGYSLFAITQLTTLYIVAPHSFYLWRFSLPLVAIGIYLVGNTFYRRLEEGTFQKLLTALILAYGALLVVK